MRIVDGFALAARINDATRGTLSGRRLAPRAIVLLDPADPGMAAYARRQVAQAAELGIALEPEPYPAGGAQAVLARLAALAQDDSIDAVATLYPLPRGVDPLAAALALGPDKDIDGLHPLNAGRLALGAPSRPPATARACRLLAEELAGPLAGLEVVLVGASRIIGRPLANLLLDAEASVTLTHAATRDLAAHTRAADIVITAAGVPGLIGPDHLRDGALVLDVSINAGPEGLVGDCDLPRLAGREVTITDVPDGVGPVTTACLMSNIAAAAR